MELKKIKCPSCGGELSILEDLDEIKCNFCGSKVIIDDKGTEVRRIKRAEIKAKKELDEHELENKKKNDNYNDEREYKKKKNSSIIKVLSIALIIIWVLFTFIAFDDGEIVSGIIGVLQIGLFGYVILLCMDILPEKIKNLHKILFIIGCILFIPFISLIDITINRNSYKSDVETLIWSEYILSEKLPEPETLKGVLNHDSSSSLSVDIANVDKSEYRSYVSACREKGFNIDVYNSTNSFSAKNEEGYSLRVYYSDVYNEYSISLDEPKEEIINEPVESDDNNKETNNSITETNGPTTNSNELRTNFKTAMDSYESFMNEYVEFMKKYNENPSSTTLLKDYFSYLEKYSKVVEDFNNWNDDEDMNTAELSYYLDVQTRVAKKLLELSD